MGTDDYSAPEVLLRDPAPFKSDIYSLGLILHFMMAKDLPNYVNNVKTGNFKIPSVYSKNIVELMESMLKKKPAMRPTVRELLSSEIILMTIEKFNISTSDDSLI